MRRQASSRDARFRTLGLRAIRLMRAIVLQIAFGGLLAGSSDAYELMFQSGFEDDVRVGGDRIIGGQAGLARSDWTKDLARLGTSTGARINFTGGEPRQRSAAIVDDPTRAGNKVLKFSLSDSWLASENERKARVQLEMYRIAPGLKAFRQSVRVYLGEGFRSLEDYPAPIGWLTLAEFWNNEWWMSQEQHGFRITVGIGKPSAASAKLTFSVEAQDAPRRNEGRSSPKTIWSRSGQAEVPIGRWFTLQYEVIEGDGASGRFVLSLAEEGSPAKVIHDIKGFTHNTRDGSPDGITGYNPMKLYTSAALMDFVKARGLTLDVLWDDIEIWRAR